MSDPGKPTIVYSPHERQAWVYLTNGAVVSFTSTEATVYHAVPTLPADLVTLDLPDPTRPPVWAESPKSDDPEPALIYNSSRDVEPPDDVRELTDSDGNTLARTHAGNWAYTVVDGKEQGPDTGAPWCDLDDEYDVAWPLTEASR